MINLMDNLEHILYDYTINYDNLFKDKWLISCTQYYLMDQTNT